MCPSHVSLLEGTNFKTNLIKPQWAPRCSMSFQGFDQGLGAAWLISPDLIQPSIEDQNHYTGNGIEFNQPMQAAVATNLVSAHAAFLVKSITLCIRCCPKTQIEKHLESLTWKITEELLIILPDAHHPAPKSSRVVVNKTQLARPSHAKSARFGQEGHSHLWPSPNVFKTPRGLEVCHLSKKKTPTELQTLPQQENTDTTYLRSEILGHQADLAYGPLGQHDLMRLAPVSTC